VLCKLTVLPAQFVSILVQGHVCPAPMDAIIALILFVITVTDHSSSMRESASPNVLHRNTTKMLLTTCARSATPPASPALDLYLPIALPVPHLLSSTLPSVLLTAPSTTSIRKHSTTPATTVLQLVSDVLEAAQPTAWPARVPDTSTIHSV